MQHRDDDILFASPAHVVYDAADRAKKLHSELARSSSTPSSRLTGWLFFYFPSTDQIRLDQYGGNLFVLCDLVGG